MARLVRWVTASGGAVLITLTNALGDLTRSLPLAAVLLVFLLVVLLFDRPAQRLNLMLRGVELPPKAGRTARFRRSAAPEPLVPTRPAETEEDAQADSDSYLGPASMIYLAGLRQDGNLELADRIERALREASAAEQELDGTARHTETRPH
jgi:hypothetical protein